MEIIVKTSWCDWCSIQAHTKRNLIEKVQKWHILRFWDAIFKVSPKIKFEKIWKNSDRVKSRLLELHFLS